MILRCSATSRGNRAELRQLRCIAKFRIFGRIGDLSNIHIRTLPTALASFAAILDAADSESHRSPYQDRSKVKSAVCTHLSYGRFLTVNADDHW